MTKMNEPIGMTEAEFAKQFRASVKKGKTRSSEFQRAVAARYDRTAKIMVFELANGVTLLVPVKLIQGLQDAGAAALADFELMSDGKQIHWGKADVQFYIEDLIRGVFGAPKWMKGIREHLAEIGRKGGSTKSEKKSVSSRANGAKGGRPARKVA